MSFIIEHSVAMGYVIAFTMLSVNFLVVIVMLAQVRGGKSWVPIEANLKDARIVTKSISGKEFSTPKLCFYARYLVEGRYFGCTKLSFYLKSNAHEKQELEKLKGREGSTVTIYVDPDKPHNSILIRPDSHSFKWPMFKALFYLSLLIFILIKSG